MLFQTNSSQKVGERKLLGKQIYLTQEHEAVITTSQSIPATR